MLTHPLAPTHLLVQRHIGPHTERHGPCTMFCVRALCVLCVPVLFVCTSVRSLRARLERFFTPDKDKNNLRIKRWFVSRITRAVLCSVSVHSTRLAKLTTPRLQAMVRQWHAFLPTGYGRCRGFRLQILAINDS